MINQLPAANKGIDPALTLLHYSSINEAVKLVTRLGTATQMAKLDLKAAYRNILVHPPSLLGMCWNNVNFLDTALPFGLRSALKIFTAVADGVIQVNGIHYLDVFLESLTHSIVTTILLLAWRLVLS